MSKRTFRLLLPEEAARLIRCRKGTLRKDRIEGHLGIPYVRINKRVFYPLPQLRSWLRTQIVRKDKHRPRRRR